MTQSQFRMLATALPGVQAVLANSAHSFPRHTHDQFGIGVVHRGAQKSRSGRGIVEAMAGDVITVNPGEVHDGVPFDETGRAWRMLYFDTGVLQAMANVIRADRGGDFEFTAPVLRHQAVSDDFNRLFQALTEADGTGNAMACEEHVLQMLSRFALRPGAPSCEPSTDILKPASSRIDDAPGEAVTLEELAGLCGINRFQLLRGFARMTGLTPHAYLLQKRLALVRQQIVEGGPLAEIAVACGFADQSHMTRLFVRQFGVTPGAYASAVAGSAISFKTTGERQR